MGLDLFCSIKDVLPLVYANNDPLVKCEAYSRLSQTCKALFDILKSYRSAFAREIVVKPLFVKDLLDLESPCWMALARRQCLALRNWMNRTPSVSRDYFRLKYNFFVACDQGLKVFNIEDGLIRCVINRSDWTDFPLPIPCTHPFTVDGYLVFCGGSHTLVYDINEERLMHTLQIENGTDLKSIRNGQVFVRDNDRFTKDYPFLVYSLENQALPKRVSLPNTFDIRFGLTHLFCIQLIDGKQLFSGIELKTLKESIDKDQALQLVQGELSFPEENCNINVFTEGSDFIIVAREDKLVHVYKACFLEDVMTFHKLSDNIPLSPFHFCRGHFYHENRLFVALIENGLFTIRLFDLETGENTASFSTEISLLAMVYLQWEAVGPSRVHCRYDVGGNDATIITFDYTK